ncbi:MAG: hypothetical protein IT269_00275 [Saprospiraceae bacterium]|nr:hypothetical protein [Saprospiraceae bacterium]
MAKSGKNTPQGNSSAHKNQPSAKAVPANEPLPVRDWFSRPEPTTISGDDRRKMAFWILAALGLVVMVALSFGSGINADDKFQVDYSQKLVNYYGTFGKDTTALYIPDGNMHLYGGFFEVTTGFANKAFGLQPTDIGYHHVRHVSSAVLGWVAILCAALLARLIAGWPAALATLIIMLLSPRFVGDSLMNPKDIPFAAGYILALYNMAAVLTAMPNPRRWNIVGLIVGLGIALGTRAGGLLPFAMLFLFTGLHFLLKNGGLRAFSNGAVLKKYALVTLGVAAAGYAFALFFWPYALQNPLKNPFIALSKFAELEVRIRVLYEGDNIMSDKTPWHYPVWWIVKTIPLAALLGFVGSVVMSPVLLRRYQPLWVLMTLFAAVFPVFYVIYKDSVLHDGWRHLTFAYPAICVAAGLFWGHLQRMFEGKKVLSGFMSGVMVALCASGLMFIISNPKMPYLYFNEIAGGLKGAYGEYETDYWGVSTRQGLEWMEQQGILRPNLDTTVVIATNMYFSTRQLTAKYGDKVKVKYLKWEKRCDDAWDYALYPTRFLDAVHMKTGQWPPKNAVHVVTADGVPILAVLKDNGKNCSLGVIANRAGDYKLAIEKLNAELVNVPNNELAWSSLASACLNAGQLDSCKMAAEKCLSISPADVQGNNILGMYWLAKQDIPKAKAQFESAIKKEPGNPGAWYYLALIAQDGGDPQTALNNLMRCIQVAPNFKPAYELAAQIYEANGESARASQFRAALSKMK